MNTRTGGLLLVFLGFLGLTLLWTQSGGAQTPPAAPEGVPPAPQGPDAVPVLPVVVVTPTRRAEDPATIPYTTHSLEAENFQVRQAARTLPQALSEIPAVSVQATAHGQESPYIRGFTGFRTLLLVDGIRVNNATFRDGPNQYWTLVDPLGIESIEVVKGPSSVLYGSDAIGGTVNALTVSNFPGGIHPGGYYRFASAERSHTVRADVVGAHDGLDGRSNVIGYAGGVSWRDLDDVSGGRLTGQQDETGFDVLSGDAKLSWMAANKLRFTTAFQASDQDSAPRTHSTVDAVSFHGTTVGTDRIRELDQTRRFTYLRSEWLPQGDWLENVSLTFSYQYMAEEERRRVASGVLQNQGFEDETGGVQLSATSPTCFGTLTYGAEWYGDWVGDSFRNDFNPNGTLRAVLPRGPVANNSRYDLVGVYIQDEYRPVERLLLIAGGRYNYAHAAADGDDIDTNATDSTTFEDLDTDYDTAVGSGRAIFQATEHISPFVGISQGFRAPNLSDLTRFDIARSNEQEVPATDLDPEYYLAYEGGVRGSWDRVHASAAYFYTDIRDMILRSPTGAVTSSGNLVVTKENVGDGYIHGVEGAVDWNFYEGFTAFGSFSWMDGKVDTFVQGAVKEEKPLSRIPPAQGLLGLRWEGGPDAAGTTAAERRSLFWVEGTLRLVYAQDRLSPEDKLDTQRIPPGGSPGYYLLGLRGGVHLTSRVSLFSGVENITDQDYRVHGSGVNGPGTNFFGGLQVRL